MGVNLSSFIDYHYREMQVAAPSPSAFQGLIIVYIGHSFF